ncbi:MAG: hypothetical protein ACK5MD_08095 [Flavobacteriales bacterium]
MKKNYFSTLFVMLCFILCVKNLKAQVGIGIAEPEAVLDVSSSNSGVLFPRVSDVSEVEKPSNSMIVYDNSQKDFYQYSDVSESWVKLGEKTSTINGSETTLYSTTNTSYNHTLEFCFTPLSGTVNNNCIVNNFCGKFMINKRPNSDASIVKILYLLDGNGDNIQPTQTSTTVKWNSPMYQTHTFTVNNHSATYSRSNEMSGRLHYEVLGLNP